MNKVCINFFRPVGLIAVLACACSGSLIKFAAHLKGMSGHKPIKRALISVFYKDGLAPIARQLADRGVVLYSTGGTRDFLEALGLKVEAVEDLTDYPSILGGRVKTLHPKVFGGILSRRNEESDIAQLEQYAIPEIDLVMVDLYPFTETLASGASEAEIIEKIDIGGVSLIRAAAKNFNDVLIISSRSQYGWLENLLADQACSSTFDQRKQAAAKAFALTAEYDSAIAAWFSGEGEKVLRYGENPHQQAAFRGALEDAIEQLHGKSLSYNNLLDIDAAIRLIGDFPGPGCAIIKHNNACGAAVDRIQLQAWRKALEGDPTSAFGGIFIFNTPLNEETAREVDALFFEVIIAPGYSQEALSLLQSKKNRIILIQKPFLRPNKEVRSVLNGVLEQEFDLATEQRDVFRTVTQKTVEEHHLADLEFAAVLVKHTKSNAITLVKNQQLIGSGTGQTSRVDALRQSIAKAASMGFTVEGSVMASDAFFPFSDNIEIAAEHRIAAIVQPGGSVRDQEVIEKADLLGIAMVTTGRRHFKH